MKNIAGMCINWKVLVGLAVVGVGVWAVAPQVIGAVAPLLFLAVCPLSMLLMMKGMGAMGGGAHSPQSAQPHAPVTDDRAAQLADLKARQEAIAREIAHLEAGDEPVTRHGSATADERPVGVH